MSSDVSASAAPALVSAPGACIGAKVLTCLEVSMHVMKCYEMVTLKPSASLLRHYHIIKNFKLEFDAVSRRKKSQCYKPVKS